MGAKKGQHRSTATEFKCGHGFSLKYKDEYVEEMLIFFKESSDVPFFEEFATEKNVTTGTLVNWAKRFDRFGAAYAVCQEIQLHKLLKGGLLGKFNPQVVKLVAMTRHGFSEKQEQKVDADVGGKNGDALKVNITVLKPDKVDIDNKSVNS